MDKYRVTKPVYHSVLVEATSSLDAMRKAADLFEAQGIGREVDLNEPGFSVMNESKMDRDNAAYMKRWNSPEKDR